MSSIQSAIELQDRMTAPLMNICSALNMMISSFDSVQTVSDSAFDAGAVEGMRGYIDDATLALNQLQQEIVETSQKQVEVPVTVQDSEPIQIQVPEPVQVPVEVPTPEPVQVPVVWQTDNTQEVFTGTGIERYEQEISSATGMMEQLAQKQTEIAQRAYNTSIFPNNAVQDLLSLSTRIDAIQTKITAVANNPMNIGTDTANSQLEQLRGQLSQAVQEQENLNQAMQQMDVSAANESYLKLSQTVSLSLIHI